MVKKGNRTLIFVVIIALVVGGAFVGILSANKVATPGKLQSLPFNIRNYTTISALFNPLTGLDVASATTAPAISCSLTNNGHLMGTDGSDFKVDSATGLWSPTYQSLVIPYNGATLANTKIIVYLYCAPSTLASYNYYPFLTGGSVTMSFKGRDSSQTLQITQAAQTQTVSPANVNGVSIPIATFTIPASAIQAGVGQTVNDYYSQQLATLTGTLIFKQGQQSYQLPATYTISPLYTAYSFLVKGTGTNSMKQPNTYVAPICTTQQFNSGYTIVSGQCVAPGQQPPNSVYCADGSVAPNGQLSQCSTPSTPGTCQAPNIQTAYGCLPQTPAPGTTPGSTTTPQIPNLPIPPLDLNSLQAQVMANLGWIVLIAGVVVGVKILHAMYGKKKGGITLSE